MLVFAIATAASHACLAGEAVYSRDQLFEEVKHDFGTVARGAKVVHKFKFTNRYDRPLVIRSVRTSCGCTRPTAPQKVIQPGETGSILAEFNTRSFLGNRSATITVSFSSPIVTEVQLTVKGNIRGDVVFQPGELEIRDLSPGKTGSVSTEIHYAGSPEWQVIDVQSSLPWLQAELKELERGNGRVKYRLTVQMDGDFPVGLLRDQLTIVTNDQKNSRIPLSFVARVESVLTISPERIEFSKTEGGNRKLVLKADQAFSIIAMTASDPRVQCRVLTGPSGKKRRSHIVSVSCEPAKEKKMPAKVKLEIQTDLLGKSSWSIWIQFK